MTDKPFSTPGDGWQPSTPLESMDYLDGYLSAVFDSDMADGAWFEAQKAMIVEHWNLDGDGHDEFMSYLEWKAKQPGSGVTMLPSPAEWKANHE